MVGRPGTDKVDELKSSEALMEAPRLKGADNPNDSLDIARVGTEKEESVVGRPGTDKVDKLRSSETPMEAPRLREAESPSDSLDVGKVGK